MKVLIVFLMIVLSVVYLWEWVTPSYEVSKKIWLPQDYSIVNLEHGGDFAKITRVEPSGTVFWLDYDEYKDRFAMAKSKVAVTEVGEVYYTTKTDEGVYATQLDFGEYSRRSKVLAIGGDGTIKLQYGRQWVDFFLYSLFVAFILLVLGFATTSKKKG